MPTLLFLPGAGGASEFWRPLGDRLPSLWRKTYLGWPGLGHQPRDPRVNSFDDLVALVEARLGAEPVDLIAQSMGGVIALRIALQHPSRVRRLVLAATSGGLDVASLGATDWRPAYQQDFPNAAPWITSPHPDISKQLPRATNPALLLWGDADPISPVAVGQRLAALLPNATLRLVHGGDHGFAHDRAEEIVEAVHRHLE